MDNDMKVDEDAADQVIGMIAALLLRRRPVVSATQIESEIEDRLDTAQWPEAVHAMEAAIRKLESTRLERLRWLRREASR